MKPFDHSEFAHEREAFASLHSLLPEMSSLELYPSVYIPDESRKVFHECDLLAISPGFAAVIELKHWHGEIDVRDCSWSRGAEYIRDPHEVNLPKAKVFKRIIEKILPAAKVPFVQSIVVLTADDARVHGADNANDILTKLYERNGRIGDHFTFHGTDELAYYLKSRSQKDGTSGLFVLHPKDFFKVRSTLDKRFSEGLRRKDYADQIPGFKIRKEIENTPRYVSYLAEASPPRGEILYRLRVFGIASADPAVQSRQFRSLDALSRLPFHPNIRPITRHPNERGLVVEVTQWNQVRTLDQLLDSGTKIQQQFAVRVVRDIANALDHLHNSEALFIHRNVTPRSIIIGRDEHVELTDFELAYDPDSPYTVMESVGSERASVFAAPEALAGLPDFSSDVFSLGKVLLKLLDVCSEKANGNDDLSAYAALMTNKNRAERPTAHAVALTLTQLLGESPQATVAPIAVSAPRVGDTHDTWTLSEVLGQGGSSQVFGAESHGDTAALKIFNTDVPREQCLAERDFLRQVHSPFVPRFRSFMQWGGAYWCIVQEKAVGISLKSLILENRRPNCDLFMEIALQMLSALAELHSPKTLNGFSAPVIHNDVTPGNIVVDETYRIAKLLDFGLASNDGDTVIGGTPGYISKKLVSKEGHYAKPEGDLFALATTLVEWATGVRPIDSQIESLFDEEIGVVAGKALASVFNRAMAETGGYQSAKEMEIDLSGALAGPSVTQTNNEVLTAAPLESSLPAEIELVLDAAQGDVHSFPIGNNQTVGLNSAFVTYLNTIHNVSADNRHALAEAQATSQFFTNLRVDMSLTESIVGALTQGDDAVIMLTGHAGDGKSTVAIELLRKAKGLAENTPLDQAPNEDEKVILNGRNVRIIKDMSELPASVRRQKLSEVIDGKGSALIVSNTGPLLSTFRQYFEGLGHDADNTEQAVLSLLDKPLIGDALGEGNCFPLPTGKKIYIANLTMLSNVETAGKLLAKLASHPAWINCSQCSAEERCPIRRNVRMLLAQPQLTQQRVRYVYQRLTAYGRRMTMRQLAAHLSFSLTGGLSCEEVIAEQIADPLSLIFSENFFGHVGTKSESATDALFCLKQMADLYFGAASTPSLDQLLYENRFNEAVEFPGLFQEQLKLLLDSARKPNGGEARRRTRRLAYLFGAPRESFASLESALVDDFLQTPMLRDLDKWVLNKRVGVGLERQKFMRKVVGVLMEEFTGCSVPDRARDRLYITLRRPDERVFQPVQIVLKAIPIDEFDLVFDSERSVPALKHSCGARLILTLPLLDYMVNRHRGELTGELDAIHRASLEQFRGELLGGHPIDQEIVTILQVDADGEMKTHKFSPDAEGQRMVYQ